MPPIRSSRANYNNPGYRGNQELARLRRQAQRLDSSVRAKLVLGAQTEIGNAVGQGVAQGLIERVLPDIQDYLSRVAGALNETKHQERIHYGVGEKALASIRNSIGQNVTAREGPASRDPAYKTRPGRLSGALGKAFRRSNDKQHIKVLRGSFSFLNPDFLDKEAAHWYRLNFGVGARGSRTQSGRYQVTVRGQAMGELGFDTGPSRDPLILPPGFFISSGGERVNPNRARVGQEGFFLPGQRKGIGAGRPVRAQVTKGIEGRQYLDAGVRRIARELPIAYEEFFRNAIASRRGTTREHVDIEIKSVGRGIRTVRPSYGARTRFRGGRLI